MRSTAVSQHAARPGFGLARINGLIGGLVLALVGGCTTFPADDESERTRAPAFHQPIAYVPEALGDYAWPVTTADADAQDLFDQGMQLRWGYNVIEAARSMTTARQLDPTCAMCWWGEAFALGSYLNGGMTAEAAPFAHDAIERAATLVDGATPLERDLILAARVRYPADYDPERRREVDQAFADAMADVYARYPDNHDVAAVYAVALFMLEPRLGYRDVEAPSLKKLHGVLTRVLDENIRHPGACHLYIHATESSQHPEWGLPCAEHLGAAVPIASHIQHMPSHTWNEVGMWGRSVRANLDAWHSDIKATREKLGFSYGASHNLHMLLFAASYDGQGAIATQAGKDYRKVTGNSMYEVLTLLRFGRFDEVLANEDRPDKPVPAALWDFARGYASLKSGDPATAERMRDVVLAFTDTTDDRFRFHPANQVTGTVAHILAGEILRDSGDLTGAIEAFRRAVAIEDEMNYDEPEPLPFAARHWLGAALLESGAVVEAEAVYREEIADHPHNGWSLMGLQEALARQGIEDAAVAADLAASWARADILTRRSAL